VIFTQGRQNNLTRQGEVDMNLTHSTGAKPAFPPRPHIDPRTLLVGMYVFLFITELAR
jgi:hypothetical protein